MPQALQETGAVTEAAAAKARETGRFPIQLISPGWGSSGYYSADVLAEAATNTVIPAGTHMYADHPTETEAKERPVRSVKDLLSVTTEDARIATDDDIAAGADPGGLVADVRVMAPYRELIEDLIDVVGVSIRGAGETSEGEADGRAGRIIESLEHVTSVDWVTRAGRGGKVLALMESAQTNHRAVRRGVAEATVNDTREALTTALREAHGGEGIWVYVRDFDDDQVWFEVENGPNNDDSGLYAQTYTGDGASLTGDRAEVRVETRYVPVTRPGGNTNPTQESEEDTMPNIEESELARLREDAGRATQLEERATAAETRATTAEAERDQLREDNARRDRRDRARTIVTARAQEAGIDFDDLQVEGLLTGISLTEAGEFDEAAFTTRVDESAATLKKRAGGGFVRNHGSTVQEGGNAITWDQIDEASGLQKGA